MLNRKKKRIADGSNITIKKYDELDMEYIFTFGWNGIWTGAVMEDNEIHLNPRFLKDKDYKRICSTISHEFLHLLLIEQFDDDVSKMLDIVFPFVDLNYTDCGGI